MALSLAVVSFTLIFVNHLALANPPSAPPLISSDSRAEVTGNISHQQVTADAPPEGGSSTYRATNDVDVTQTFELDGSSLLYKQFQGGFAVPLAVRGVANQTTDVQA